MFVFSFEERLHKVCIILLIYHRKIKHPCVTRGGQNLHFPLVGITDALQCGISKQHVKYYVK